MKRRTWIGLVLLVVFVALAATGCSTLSVRIPAGMFVSTGDYVPGIRTIGIVQEHMRVWAPLFLLDVNKVHERLYKQLIEKAQEAGANGVTNISFYWKPAPITYVTILALTPVLDFYIEAVAIEK